VQDDGARPESGHYGIIGMRERVEPADGSFAIRSQPGNGTLVVAELALNLSL